MFFPTGKFLEIETQILICFRPPDVFNNPLSCEGESALQTINGLKSSSDVGKILDQASQGSARVCISQAGSEELLKGQSPSPAPWWDLCVATVAVFAPHSRTKAPKVGAELQGEVLPWTHRKGIQRCIGIF